MYICIYIYTYVHIYIHVSSHEYTHIDSPLFWLLLARAQMLFRDTAPLEWERRALHVCVCVIRGDVCVCDLRGSLYVCGCDLRGSLYECGLMCACASFVEMYACAI